MIQLVPLLHHMLAWALRHPRAAVRAWPDVKVSPWHLSFINKRVPVTHLPVTHQPTTRYQHKHSAFWVNSYVIAASQLMIVIKGPDPLCAAAEQQVCFVRKRRGVVGVMACFGDVTCQRERSFDQRGIWFCGHLNFQLWKCSFCGICLFAKCHIGK